MSGPGSSQTGSNQPGASSSDSRESGIGQSGSRRAASSLELFLDLAFVFAISQIATYLAEHLTVAGSLRALLLAWFAWWQWTAFTWAGATIDLKERGPIRVMVLCLVPVVLICSVALPRALVVRRGFGLVGEGGSASSDFVDDLVRGLGPDERLGVVVPV